MSSYAVLAAIGAANGIEKAVELVGVATLPFAHIGGLSVIVRCLLAGATVVARELPRPAQDAYQLLAEQRITAVSLVPNAS